MKYVERCGLYVVVVDLKCCGFLNIDYLSSEANVADSMNMHLLATAVV